MLMEQCSNNVAEYQALILGLEMAIEMKLAELKVLGDSKLMVSQILSLYDVKKLELVPYVRYATKLLGMFYHIDVEHVPRM